MGARMPYRKFLGSVRREDGDRKFWRYQDVPGILDVWYPGTRGGDAVAALLFGDVAPGGKLPFTWPRTVGQVPMIYSHTRSHQPQRQDKRYWDEESTPLFPFGYGLSYGRLTYGTPSLSADSIAVGETLTVSVSVTNEGSRSADEVVQLYLHQRHGSSSRPVRELKGFQRITLPAGASTTVEFRLGAGELSYWSAAARDWVQDATTVELGVGGDSTVALSSTFTVTA
jgi:beta-glucosidase